MSRPRRHHSLLAYAIFALTTSACSGNGCGCGLDPLPGGALPPDQTVEGGAQVRVTPAGFDKLTSIVPGVINDSVSNGFCLPKSGINLVLANVDYCDSQDGMCNPGCQVDVNVDSVNMSVPEDDVFRISTQFDVDTDVHVTTKDPIWGSVLDTCTLHVNLDNGHVEADVGFGIDPDSGELTMSLDDVRTLDLTGASINGCGVVGDILDAVVSAVTDLFQSALGSYLIDAVEPLLDNMIQGFLPDPLGIEGVADLTSLFGGFSPGTNASLEMRMVPGGYVHLENSGLSLGVITGINADEDPDTRTPDLDSEPALCVPPLPAPDFSQPPAELPKSPRDTFRLLPADAFRGSPDPSGTDLLVGASKTFFNLAGHHAVTSGALCLGLGTNLTAQLTLGTLGILVPSLAELGETGDEPLLLVTRPTKAVTFDIGEGTEEDPSLTAHIKGFEVDFYAFIFERYVRGFTLSLDLDLGINLEFTTDDQGNPAILPTLVGLESDNIGIEVLNEEFLREDKASLEAVLPTVFDLAVPMLANGFSPIALPEFAGFQLTDLQTSKVTTDEDEFLAISAGLGPGSMMAKLAQRYPSVAAQFDDMQTLAAPAPPVQAGAELVRVDTPKPEAVRAALMNQGGAMPEVVLDLAKTDDSGRELEWTWNLDGGMWRSFMPGGRVTLRDRAFAIQGRYEIQLKPRLVGDYRTLAREPIRIPVVIDSVGPRILADQAQVDDQDLTIPAHDLVSPPEAVDIAYGSPGKKRPKTRWGDGTISISLARGLARGGRDLKVYARDELGNESTDVVDLDSILGFHGQTAGNTACQCSSGGTDPAGLAGTLLLLGLSMLLAFGGRGLRRALGTLFAILAAGSLPACSCGGHNGAMMCELDEDCAAQCQPNQVPLCYEGQCLCADDVPRGRIGQYSDMALGSNGALWVSAYNSYHGDLMVARWDEGGRIPAEEWQFIDGVPDGPVVVEGSDIRGGIFEPGEDVGLYTSIGVTDVGTAMVAYFDRTNASLKFAANYGGEWQTYTVDKGQVEGDPELGYEIVGQYTALTIRQSDQHPGIAYFAQVSDGSDITTEVRFAQATVAEPRSASDWNIEVAADAVAPAPDPQNPDPLTIPMGTGLFVNAARLSDGSPALVYYNRLEHELMLSEYDSGSGSFNDPQVLDGGDVDVGWYPGVAVDENDDVHVSYVSATNDDLLYVSTADMSPQVVDDGYRIVGQTDDMLPKPEFHFIGDDSSLVLTSAGPVAVYQDSTSHELLLARKNSEGKWQHETIAGDEDPFAGGYGFYADAEYDGKDVVMSTWVVDQPDIDAWVEIFRRTVTID